MYLKSLEINGFKSFAKKGNLSFTQPITSIVGPNGSGKSNVAESFRFVLGEQSIKSMRGKKGEDLIFNGSKDSARSNRASVKVTFDNSRRIFNIDFDELTIERVVHRDGVNEYLLNNSPVRLKDVIELLAGAHIGSSGHHIISQGEADRILSASIRERREMVEDALGLKIYQYKKDESERKLERTFENISQVESLRRELSPHIRFLKKQVEKIEKAMAMRLELVGLYKIYFKRESEYLNIEKNKISEQKHSPSEELKNLESELSLHRETLRLAESESGRSSELIELERVIGQTRSTKDSLTRELGRLEGEISYLKRSIDKKIREAEELGNKTIYLSEVEVLTNDLSTEINNAMNMQDVSLIKSALEKIRQTLNNFISHHKNSGLSPEIGEEQKEIERISEASKKIEADLLVVADQENKERQRYDAIKSEIEKEKDKNVESEKAILRIMSKQNELHTILENLRLHEEKLKIETEDFNRELHEAAMLAGREAIHYDEVVLPEVPEDRSTQIDRRRQIERIKIRLEETGGAGGDDVMKEFTEAEERDAFLARELTDLQLSADSLKKLITELVEKLDLEFKEGIRKINIEFGKFFSLMFGGGHAGLEVVKEEKRKRRKTDEDDIASIMDAGGDSEDEEKELEEGIDITVNLPHKRTKGLMMLSGGERALTSIALLFAISQVNPPPFIILDETDAALDEANSRKYGDMIEALSKHSQLILITHNRETMSRAGVIYGVTMGSDGQSKLLSIAFDEAVAVAK